MQIAREILRQEVQQGGLRGTESLRMSFSQAGSKPRHFRLDFGNKALSLTAAGSELIIKLLGARHFVHSWGCRVAVPVDPNGEHPGIR